MQQVHNRGKIISLNNVQHPPPFPYVFPHLAVFFLQTAHVQKFRELYDAMTAMMMPR